MAEREEGTWRGMSRGAACHVAQHVEIATAGNRPSSPAMEEDFGVDLDQVRAFLAAREQRRRARIDERYAQATRDVRTIVSEIAAQVNPRRIYQWGSLLDRRRFTEISDLDIAVEGLNGPAEYFQVLGIVMNATALPIGIVELEKVPADIAEHIRKRGVLVHERSDP